MNKKVLVFFPGPLVPRHGGPFSVLYHLYQGLKHKQHTIDFLSDLMPPKPLQPDVAAERSHPLKKIFKPFLPSQWIYGRRISGWFRQVEETYSKTYEALDLSAYGCLHFHTSFDLWRYQALLKNYKGIIVLTSHSPKPYHLELLEDALSINISKLAKRDYERVEAIDLFAYGRADYLVFPCKQSAEPYLAVWPRFKHLFDQKKQSFLPTGIVSVAPTKTAEEIRAAFGIPMEAFVVSFVGRKLQVKGYDLFVAMAQKILAEKENVFFLVVGNKSVMPAISHPRFIETGWSNDPLSYVQAANLHVIPNRYSNFDLNILEGMALGIPILLSDTGGNKYFKPFHSAGMIYHEPTVNSLLTGFENCFSSRTELPHWGEENRSLQRQYFTAERFADDHLQFYKSIFL